ncbi:MAG: hypothetical protein NT045_07135 [Candidatus Aureabacteria bacterium]|nr:hypothetical protein [Candidatus Auribacterota bacterium]
MNAVKRVAGQLLCLLMISAVPLCSSGIPSSPSVEERTRTVLELMAVGRGLLGRGEYRGAAIEFEKVLQLDPANSSAADYLKQCARGGKVI